ncbi:6-phosphogluconolactonase [Candidatus Saccharibacteria bacterium]|nr:6-phosphogluconolactonase [Candidatus Saccharibacteria bacterium]
MHFSTERVELAVGAPASAVATELQAGKRVLWLVSGGSAVGAQVQIMYRLGVACGDFLENLHILPVDERYGPVGHADSNSEQMRKAGFNPAAANWHDVLTGSSMQDTVHAYGQLAEKLYDDAAAVIATLGLGPDGHTAGVLPHSPATNDPNSSVVGYEWSDHQRMTLDLSLLREIDQAFVLAYGETKETAIQRLVANTEPLVDLPAKVLYDIPTVTVYNDFVESEGNTK